MKLLEASLFLLGTFLLCVVVALLWAG